MTVQALQGNTYIPQGMEKTQAKKENNSTNMPKDSVSLDSLCDKAMEAYNGLKSAASETYNKLPAPAKLAISAANVPVRAAAAGIDGAVDSATTAMGFKGEAKDAAKGLLFLATGATMTAAAAAGLGPLGVGAAALGTAGAMGAFISGAEGFGKGFAFGIETAGMAGEALGGAAKEYAGELAGKVVQAGAMLGFGVAMAPVMGAFGYAEGTLKFFDNAINQKNTDPADKAEKKLIEGPYRKMAGLGGAIGAAAFAAVNGTIPAIAAMPLIASSVATGIDGVNSAFDGAKEATGETFNMAKNMLKSENTEKA